MIRLVCPRCKHGKLAPARPARADVRRYCLPCSEKTGRLVERISPAAQRRHADRLHDAAKRLAEEQAYPGSLRVVARQWARLTTWEVDLRNVCFELRRSRIKDYSTGRAYYRTGRIVVTAGRNIGDGYATLLHELAHHAGVRRPGPAKIPGHGPDFYRLLARAGEEVLGHSLELPLGPASRSVNRLLAVAFAAEVAAGRLPDWPGGTPPPDPRPLARRDPAHVSIPPVILADVEDVLQCMSNEATDEETEAEAAAEASAAGWASDILIGNNRQYFPVHVSAASMWQRVARALFDRGTAADLAGLRKLANEIWRALGDPRGDDS